MRLRSLVFAVLILGLIALAAIYVATSPSMLSPADLKPRAANVSNGETMFNIGGCVSCHTTVNQSNRLSLGGGLGLHTAFGTFKVPNISSDPRAGIGEWTELEFANAMLRGVGRRGEHLYPSFPFTSYQRMKLDDVRDLYAFLKTVPREDRQSEPHQISFPFNIRLALGGWKLLFVDGRSFVPDPAKDAIYNRGAYLVEGPGHCAECHSPRNVLGGIEGGRRFAGGATPDGQGWVPNITRHADGLESWTVKDMADFLQSGFTPDGRSVDPEMAAVIANTAKLTPDDRSAMALYLNALTPRPGKRPQKSAQ